ncbi:MAG: NADH-quinone oxidoreductase subunit A [bacterium]|nr:NADH-quinone oxidoreductase subunit A [bacterium]
MLTDYALLGVFFIVGIIFPIAAFITSWLLRPKKIVGEKTIPYECGEKTIGGSRFQFNVRYYVIALIFVIFDVEALFIIPWAVVFKSLGWFAYLEMMLFIAILIIGLAYAWKKGALEWL